MSDRLPPSTQLYSSPNPLAPAACTSAETNAPANPHAPPSPPAPYAPRLHQVLDALPVCISYADAQQRYCFMNHTYEVWMERQREELYGKAVQEVIGDAAYQLAAPFIEQVLQGKSVHYEAALPYETGKTRQVSVLLVPDWSADQQVQGYYALVTDISDRKALEQTSQQTSLQLQEVLHSACAAVVSFRLYANVEITWGYDYRSPGAEALFGYTAEELMADPLLWLSRVLPEDRQTVIAPTQTQLLQGQSVTFEYRFRHRDGSIRWISSVASSTYVPPEHCWRVTAVDIDITQRKRTEEALQQSQARLKTAQSIAQIGNWEFDLAARKVTWSDQMFAIYGLEAALGEPSYADLVQKFVPEDRTKLENAVSDAIRLGKPYVLDLRLMQPDGSIVYLESRGQAQFDAQGQVIKLYGTTQNITERKRLELALKQRSQRESALNQVIQSIRNSLDLPTIFASAVQETAELLRLIRVSIMQYRPAQKCWLLRAEYVPPDSPSLRRMGLAIPHENNPLGDQIARGEIVRLDDNRQSPGAVNQTLAAQLPGRWLLVPLKIGEMIWGSLSLTREIALDPWQDWEVEVAQAVADQLAIAIQQSELFQQVQLLNTRLEDQVQRRTAQLQQAIDLEAHLKRITDKVRDSLDEHQILHTAVTELGVGLGVERCQAGLYDFSENTLTICYEYLENSQLQRSQGQVLPLDDQSEVHQAVLAGQCVQVCYLEPSPAASAEPATGKPFALLVCPIMHDQNVLGSLWLCKPHHDSFKELETRLVQQVANQCAIALRQSRLYQSAQQQVDELARLNYLKDDFLSTVSHELRSPMSSVKMAAEMLEILLQRKAAFDDPQVLQYFKILQTECDRETHLINDLLDLSRLTANTEPLLLTTLELQSWILHVAEPFIGRAQKHQQALQFDLSPGLPALTTDFSYLERILTELLHNACKYTPPGECIQITAHASQVLDDVDSGAAAAQEEGAIADTSARSAGPPTLQYRDPPALQDTDPLAPSCEICVTNTGVEIPLSERDRIFEKFYRIPNSDPWKHGGTGLGLALAQRRAEQIHASITVSGDRHATTFTIKLPLLPPGLARRAT